MKNLQGLIKEIKYAQDSVEFYNKLYADIDIGNISDIEGIEELPFTAKVDYRKNFPKRTLAEGFSPKHPMLTSSRSSGSTGERLITLEIGMFLLKRAMSCAQINPNILNAFSKVGRKVARYAAPNCSDVECANPNSTIEDRILADNTLILPVYHDLLTTSEQMIERTIEEIKTYEPDLFYVDPTHFAFLLREYAKRDKKPPNIPVMLAYTGATRCAKRQVGEFYPNAMFGELLSSTEFGWVAMECEHGHLHVNDDSFFFEYVDTDITSLFEHPFKELCISSIDQGASPHLRYRTADICTVVPGTCECGSSRQRIVMEGKISHFLIRDGKPVMSPQQVDKLIGGPDWLDLYQLEQMTENSFLLKMIVNDRYSTGAEQYFIDALEKALQIDITVTTNIVDYISAERSGKFQFVRGLHSDV